MSATPLRTLRSQTPGLEFTIQSDTGVYREGQGYERVLVVTDWHREQKSWLAQVHIRVDRNPTDSFAEGSVWLGQSTRTVGREPGWEPVHATNPVDWWRTMPGYLRWSHDTSDRDTLRLAAELMTRMRSLDLY